MGYYSAGVVAILALTLAGDYPAYGGYKVGTAASGVPLQDLSTKVQQVRKASDRRVSTRPGQNQSRLGRKYTQKRRPVAAKARPAIHTLGYASLAAGKTKSGAAPRVPKNASGTRTSARRPQSRSRIAHQYAQATPPMAAKSRAVVYPNGLGLAANGAVSQLPSNGNASQFPKNVSSKPRTYARQPESRSRLGRQYAQASRLVATERHPAVYSIPSSGRGVDMASGVVLRNRSSYRDRLVPLTVAYRPRTSAQPWQSHSLGRQYAQTRRAVAAESRPIAYSISGVALDPSEAVVSGAKVTLRRRAGDQDQSTVTNEAGVFRFDVVPVGRCEILVEQSGFKPSRTRLNLGPHPPTPLRVVLEIADLHEAITVDGGDNQVNTEISENLDVVKWNRQALDDLPIMDNDIVGALSQALDLGSVGTSGVTLVVDGMETKEIGVSGAAIEEVKLNRNPYSAEFSRPGSGRIEVTTKVGSSKYHGSISFGLRDYRLDARNPFAATRPPEQHRLFDGNLSGPVGKSKNTTFLISATRKDDDLQPLVYAVVPSGVVRENVPNPWSSTFVSTGINHQLGKNNTLSLRYEYSDDSSKNEGVGGFNLPEVATNLTSRSHHIYYSQRTLVSSKFVNEFSFRAGSHDSLQLSQTPGTPKIVVLDAFTGGSAQVNSHGTENHIQFSDVLSWNQGKHFIKTGINVPDLSRRGSNERDNFGGTYYFSSLAEYSLGRPFTYTLRQGDSRLVFWQKELGMFFQDDIRIRPNFSIGLGLRYEKQNYLADRNNVAPRMSFAFAPGKERKTVFRGGVGVFYDRTGPGPIADTLRFDGQRMQQFVVSNPDFLAPLPLAGTSAQPSSIARFAPDLRSPYNVQSSFGVERQLRKSTTLSATYTNIKGIKLFRSRDINAPLPPLYSGRPDPTIGVLREFESSAGRTSNSLSLALQGNMSRFFKGMVQYTTGRVYDNSSGINSFPANNYNLSGEWSRADFDERHRLRLNGTLTPGKLFRLGVVLSMYSGRPYSLTTGRDENQDGLPNDRPPGVGRNSLQGFGTATLDLRWSREFKFHKSEKDKGAKATISLDAFNVLNRVNYNTVVGNLSSPFFGEPISARSARRMQVTFGFRF